MSYLNTLIFAIVLLGSSLTLPQIASAQNTHRWGGIFSLTGYGTEWGQAEANGTILAVEELNAKGGLRGKALELSLEDNHSSATTTVNAFSKLVDIDRVPVVFGPNWSEFAEPVAPIAEARRIPMLTASGWTPTMTLGRSFVFVGIPTHSEVVHLLCTTVASGGYKHIALVNTENAYFSSLASACEEILKKAGAPLKTRETFQPESADFRSFLSRAKRDGVDAMIFFVIEGGGNLAFVTQLRTLQFEAELFTGNAVLADPELLKHPKLIDGIVAFDFALQPDTAFQDRYTKRFGVRPSNYAARAYDLANLAFAAAETCSEFPSGIARCIRQTEHQGASGRVAFTSSGNFRSTTEPTQLLIARRGVFIAYDR